MKNKNLIIAGIALVALLVIGFGAYAGFKVLKKPVSSGEQMNGLKLYKNDEYGFEFQYPARYSFSAETNGALISLEDRTSKDLTYPNLIRMNVLDAKNAKTFLEFNSKYPITDPNSGQPYKMEARTLGTNTFYFARTERFEGVLSFSYYFLKNNKIFVFTSVSRGVDWTNPNLDEEKDSTHLSLKQMLSNFKISTPVVLDQSINWVDFKYEEAGYSLKHPNDFLLEKNQETGNVTFFFPASYTNGTNLASDSKIEVLISGDEACKPNAFLESGGMSNTITALSSKTTEDIVWTGGTTNDAGAGNFYVTSVYTAKINDVCYGVKLFLHSHNIGAYAPGAAIEFNKQKIQTIYNQMLGSIRFSI